MTYARRAKTYFRAVCIVGWVEGREIQLMPVDVRFRSSNQQI